MQFFPFVSQRKDYAGWFIEMLSCLALSDFVFHLVRLLSLKKNNHPDLGLKEKENERVLSTDLHGIEGKI
jgi:hypothetical protein